MSADPQPARDVLRALEERLARASSAAERLVAEAARAVGEPPVRERQPPAGTPPEQGRQAAAGGPPEQGWQDSAASQEGEPGDLELLLGVVARLRDLLPDDMRTRLVDALHELLLAVRALLDWYIERVEHRRSEPPPVRDIPIL